MENKNTEIVKKDENISLGRQSFIDRMIEKSASFEDIKRVGEAIINSGFCPAHFKENRDSVGIVMCIEAGQQLGLSWMQSLSNLYPVKGMIGIMGDAAKALIISKPFCEYWIEDTEGTYPNDDYKHIIRSKRKGLEKEYYSEFSIWEAKQAGLFNKDMYKKWGKRMVAYRNIGFHARDKWADVMKGFKTKEELEDYDETITITTSDGKIITTTDTKQNDLKEKSLKTTSSVVDSIQKKKEMLEKSNTPFISKIEELPRNTKDFQPEKSEKRRGRKPGSKNKPKISPETNENIKEEPNIIKEEKPSDSENILQKYGDFIIPPLQNDGERLFGDAHRLYFWMEDNGLDEKKYLDSVVELIQISEKYPNMQELADKATAEEIGKVIEKFNKLK